ncbi:DUF3152 domain-containing protein [Desertihabitans brevis]|uniref:DUF3152 domain-containing protein n=1 Tax=Desertihabitans brevis TaxID=2268447 RepID=A0A367YS45_9ACTN|nr:DUF3152 domain-containing protein [Desertihabitans brevis]
MIVTDPTDTASADVLHPTGGSSPRRAAPGPRRAVPARPNYRLWVLVAALVLALPIGIVGVRSISPAVELDAEPVVPPPAPASTELVGPTADPDAAPPPEPEPEPSPEPTVPTAGSQEYTVAKTTRKPSGKRGEVLRYRVRVERDLDLDAEATAKTIAGILDDERSWTGDGSVRFQLVGRGDRYDFTIYVTTPDTTDELCYPLLTRGEVSCRNGDNVVLNAKRWVFGADAYGDDITGYRQYLVNHEVGHRLGYDHVDCPAAGERAPIMMQQTKSVGECEPHPWVKSSDR